MPELVLDNNVAGVDDEALGEKLVLIVEDENIVLCAKKQLMKLLRTGFIRNTAIILP